MFIFLLGSLKKLVGKKLHIFFLNYNGHPRLLSIQEIIILHKILAVTYIRGKRSKFSIFQEFFHFPSIFLPVTLRFNPFNNNNNNTPHTTPNHRKTGVCLSWRECDPIRDWLIRAEPNGDKTSPVPIKDDVKCTPDPNPSYKNINHN